MKRTVLISILLLNLIGFSAHSQTKPLFYYPFNGNTNDESGNGNTCTNYGATLTTDRFGNENSAYYFDGETAYMEINPISPDFLNITDFTLSVWIKKDGWQKTNDNPENRQFIFDGHTGSKLASLNSDILKKGFAFAIDNDVLNQEKKYYIHLFESYTPLVFNEKNITNNIEEKWTHIVIIRNLSTLKIFSNGSLINSSNNMNADISNMLHELYIGTNNGNNNNYYYKDYNFEGSIDEVLFFKQALDQKQVIALRDISEPIELIEVTSKIKNESLPLAKDGEIDLTISGGVKPYTITWNNFIIGTTINGLSKGNYTIKIIDAIGIQKEITLFVDANQPLPIQIISNIINESLPLAKDGEINLTISGGVKPYTITWNNSMIGPSIKGLSKGNYSAKIIDAIGTIYSYSTIISNNFLEPIAFYPFNSNTTDETGHENTCENYNAQLTTDRFGMEKSAYYFDGMNSYLEITPKSEEFKNITDFTISMWYKKDGWQDNRNNPTNRQYLFCGHTGLNSEINNENIYKKGFSLALDYNKINEEKSYYKFLCDTYTPLSFNDQIVPNNIQQRWTSIIFERKGEETMLYENGKLIASKIGMSANITDMFHSLYIGTANGNNLNYFYSEYNFRGSIDEVIIWNKALNQNEIQYVINNNLSPIVGTKDTLSIKGKVSNKINCANKGTIVAFDMIMKKYYPTKYDIIQNDYYIIPGLRQSKYIIYCIPDNTTEDFITPCYYPNVKYWQEAYQIDLTGNATNVNLMTSGNEENIKEGIGSISGKINVPDSINIKENIFKTIKYNGETIIIGLPIILRENNKIIGWTRTDTQGNYSFNNLANGTYEIVVEFQPIETQTKSVTLKDNFVESIENNFRLYSTQTNSEINKSDSITIYPTITQSTAEIQCPNFKSYIIVNPLGEVVIPKTTNTNINICELVSGLYYILITNSLKTISVPIIKE